MTLLLTTLTPLKLARQLTTVVVDRTIIVTVCTVVANILLDKNSLCADGSVTHNYVEKAKKTRYILQSIY